MSVKRIYENPQGMVAEYSDDDYEDEDMDEGIGESASSGCCGSILILSVVIFLGMFSCIYYVKRNKIT